jgi:hypothetical protein
LARRRLQILTIGYEEVIPGVFNNSLRDRFKQAAARVGDNHLHALQAAIVEVAHETSPSL